MELVPEHQDSFHNHNKLRMNRSKSHKNRTNMLMCKDTIFQSMTLFVTSKYD